MRINKRISACNSIEKPTVCGLSRDPNMWKKEYMRFIGFI